MSTFARSAGLIARRGVEANAMLNCRAVVDGDRGAVGTDGFSLITRLLLDDDGIVRGACSSTAFNE
jgi:hypothetical protein